MVAFGKQYRLSSLFAREVLEFLETLGYSIARIEEHYRQNIAVPPVELQIKSSREAWSTAIDELLSTLGDVATDARAIQARVCGHSQ